MKFADVILPQALNRNYTYSIPSFLENKVRIGCRVAVQFGRKRKYAAVVKNIRDEQGTEIYQVKPILDVLDEQPVLNPEQLTLWSWMAQYYMCTEGEVMNAALPAFLKLTSETNVLLNPDASADISLLSEEEYLVAEALQIHNQLKLEEIQQILDKKNVYPVINAMIQKGICLVNEELKRAYKAKKESFLYLNPALHSDEEMQGAFEQLKNAPKQEQAFLAFLSLRPRGEPIAQKQVQEKAGVPSSIIKALSDKGLIRVEKERVDRIPVGPALTNGLDGLTLNEDQQNGFEEILNFFNHQKNVLLHGVTSSGKTMVYIKLIESFLNRKKQILYLLPEIALTAQIIRRLQHYFGNRIGVYHSKFNNNERVEIWNKVKSGEYEIILGARSALMLPYKNLGLIILDEEHDASYKQQDPAPRYHARDTALYYAQLFSAHVLMGSATPSLESYHNAREGKYGLVQLKKRFGDIEMPEVRVVDMKKIVFPRNSIKYLSPQLDKEIKKALAQEKQVILFQNRRGYAPSIQCQVCGWTPKCKNCDVSLTYHKFHQKLHCHYCGQQYPVPETCEACGSHRLVNRNFGTERVAEELSDRYPEARIERMDYDTVKNKYGHQKLIDRFERHEIDILIGTQMIVKGLDFGRVNLVGVLSVDNLLAYPDFRLNERAFQLLTQVSGRSGRRDGRGEVLLQTLNTSYPVLEYVIRNDYEGFYETEVEERKTFRYPPFTRLIRIVLKHRKSEIVFTAGNILREAIQPYFKTSLLGPSVPLVGRVRNQYRMEMLIKIPKNMTHLEKVKQYLSEQFSWLQRKKGFSQVTILPDVDCI